jgi:hypothetical protein
MKEHYFIVDKVRHAGRNSLHRKWELPLLISLIVAPSILHVKVANMSEAKHA